MATDPVGIGDDLEAVVARARREAEEAGELASWSGPAVAAGIDPDVRDFILGILRDGTYAEAVSELARRDPDQATQ